MKALMKPFFVVLIMAALETSAGIADAQTLTQSMNEARKALADAQALDQAGKYREARVQYLRAIRLNPHSEEAFEQYALFLYARGKFKEGAKALRIGLKINPEMDLLNAYLGMQLYRLGRVQEAWVKMKAAESSFKDKFVLQAIYAQLSMILEEYKVAAKAIKRYLDTRPAGLESKDFAFRVQLALALMRSGSLKEAEGQLTRALDARPDSVRARIARAELLLLEGKCADALDAYRQIVPRVKADYLSLYIGQAYVCMRRAKDARRLASVYLEKRAAQLKRFLAKPPSRQDQFSRSVKYMRMGLVLRGDAAMRLKSYNEALEDYRRASVLSGGAEQVELKVAGAHYQLGEYDKTLEKLVDPLKNKQADPAVLILALRAAVRTKKTDLAKSVADRLVNDRGATPTALYYAGMAYNSAGEFNQAADLLERALVIEPKHRGARNELVRAYAYQAKRALRERKPKAAEELLSKALKLESRSVKLRTNLSLVMFVQERYEDALGQAEMAYNLDPKDPTAQRLAGRALAAMGKHAKALAYYSRALKDREQGAATAQIMLEAAASRVAEGAINQGLGELDQALKMVQADPKQKTLMTMIQRDIVRAHLMRGRYNLDRGAEAAAWKDFSAALKHVGELPENERAVVQASAIFSAIVAGQYAQGRKMMREYRRAYASALKPPFNEAAGALMGALVDYASTAVAIKLRGATRLEKLAARLGGAAEDKLKDLAGGAYAQVGESLFRYGRSPAAQVNLLKARRLLRTVPLEVRHNSAVADYYAGKRDEALRVLQATSGKIPVALCNLAVHYEERGQMTKAYELFSQCDQRGARFKGLKAILEIKRQIFGKQ